MSVFGSTNRWLLIAALSAGIGVLHGCKTMEGLRHDLETLSVKLGAPQPVDIEPLPEQNTDSSPASSASAMEGESTSVKASLVRETQEKLLQLGYDVGTPDGRYGAKTEAAIQDFQLDNDLGIDGKPSASLLRVINARLE